MVALKKLQRPENAVWSRQGVIQADGDMDGTFADADSLICLECASGLGRSGDVDVIRVRFWKRRFQLAQWHQKWTWVVYRGDLRVKFPDGQLESWIVYYSLRFKM